MHNIWSAVDRLRWNAHCWSSTIPSPNAVNLHRKMLHTILYPVHKTICRYNYCSPFYLPSYRYNRPLPLFSQFVLISKRINTFMDLNQFCWDLIDTWWFGLFSFPIANWTQRALCSSNSRSAVCNSLYLTPLTLCTFNSWQKCSLHQTKSCGSNLIHF